VKYVTLDAVKPKTIIGIYPLVNMKC